LIFIGGTISGIITTLDTGTSVGWLDELNVVVIPKADTSPRVALTPSTAARIVLAARILGVQAREFARLK